MQRLERLKSWWQQELDDDIRIQLAVLLGAICVMTYMGPFGTNRLGFVYRLSYWSLSLPSGFLVSAAFNRWLRPHLIRTEMTRWVPLAHVASITIGVTLVVYVLEWVFRTGIPIRHIGTLMMGVGVISTAIWGTVMLGLRRGDPVEKEGSDPAFEAFRQSWPAQLQSAMLYAMSAEDHYIRLITNEGEALIAGRLGEAIDAVSQQKGTQVHRSWWVSDTAVAALDRRGGKWILTLLDETQVPVSRRYRPEVRAMEWDKLTH